MHKINITERIGNRSNEALPAWYKEKVKVMAEIIMKKMQPDSYSTRDFVNANAEKEVVVK